MREQLYLALYQEADHAIQEHFYYMPGEVPRSVVSAMEEVLLTLESSVEDASRLYTARGHGLPLFDRKLVQRACALVDKRGALGALLRFDSDEFARRTLEENSKEAYDENLDHFAETASASAVEEREWLAENAQAEAEELVSVLEEIGKEIKMVEVALGDAIALYDAINA